MGTYLVQIIDSFHKKHKNCEFVHVFKAIIKSQLGMIGTNILTEFLSFGLQRQ
jgi:hypothetical protein